MSADEPLDERSVDELIEMAEALPETAGLTDGLAAIRGTAEASGVTVSVDINGMLVDLDLTDEALELGAPRLAAEISRLTAEASAAALREGVTAISAVCGEELAAVVRDHLGLDAEPPRRESTVERPADDDFGEVQSWALPV